jgi:hypothetical protein
MPLVTTKDIIIPAGTAVDAAPHQTRRFTAHGEVLIGFDRDTTSSLTFDIEEAVAAGVIADRQPFDQN